MKKLLFNKIFLLFLILPASLFAQDITGLWKGEMYVDSTKKYLPYEISISEVKGKLVGYSHISFEENGKMEIGIRDITVERKNNQVIIEDVSLIDNSFSFVPPKNIKKTMLVTLTVDDTSMILKGNWSTNRTKRFLSATGSVKLQRKSDYKATVLYKRLTEIKLVDQLVFKEPIKKAAPEVTIAAITKVEKIATPDVLINPDVAKKSAPVKVTKAPEPTAITTINKPVENKLPPPIVVVKPTAIVTEEVKPAIIKPVPPKPLPTYVSAPTIAVVSKPQEIKKAVTEVSKQAPPPVAVVSVTQEKLKEIIAVVAEKKPPSVITASIVQGAADVNKRTIATTQSVYYHSDSLVLTLYDNGYVDGDTVSVVMNGEVIFSKQGLSTRAVSKTIYITKDTPDSIKLVMYAENLGSIPPNTGLLVVHDGEAVYDVRFSADLQSNAAIILQRKKKE